MRAAPAWPAVISLVLEQELTQKSILTTPLYPFFDTDVRSGILLDRSQPLSRTEAERFTEKDAEIAVYKVDIIKENLSSKKQSVFP
jgi:hypothetical protein